MLHAPNRTDRRQLIILALALIVVMLGFGMAMPVFPFMITQMGGSGNEYGLLIALAAFTQLIFAPLWGSVSDRVGRKPVLLIGIIGSGLTLVLFGVATELWMLFAGRALSGLLASATAPAAMAYVGDSTAEEDRGEGIGQLGGAASLGVILGPGLGGWLAGDSLTRPFFIAALLSLVSALLVALLLPESRSATQRQAARGELQFVGFGELWRSLRGPIGLLLGLAFLVSFGATNFQAIFGLYAMAKFGFNPQQVGTILVVVGVVSAVIQGTLTGPLCKRWGEIAVIKISFLTNALGFLVLLLANSYETVLLTTGIYILSHTLLRPAVQSLTSRRSGDLGQGVAMGLNNSFISLGQIAGPIWGGFAFDVNAGYPYLSGAVILFVGFLIALARLGPGKADIARAETGLE